jgi:hypothetical protein
MILEGTLLSSIGGLRLSSGGTGYLVDARDEFVKCEMSIEYQG